MGKPYRIELEALPKTYEWCLRAGTGSLDRAIALSSSKGLVCIGSGGSLSAAYFTAALHQTFTGAFAKAVTPLEAAGWKQRFDELVVLLLSAGGRNSDVIGIFKHLVVQEPYRLINITGRKKSPLASLAEQYEFVDTINLALPSGSDGFLATNSLLGFATLVSRAYQRLYRPEQQLPATLKELVNAEGTFQQFFRKMEGTCAPLWERDNLIVLYSPFLQGAAYDIESKFTEAALGTVQIADYRHFAHGRHHWLAKRANKTGVLALIHEPDVKLADQTLNLLPTGVPIARLHFGNDNLKAALASLVSSICIAAYAGKARGIDPGRPGVPEFGRRIYHLNGISKNLVKNANTAMGRRAIIIARKSPFINNKQQLAQFDLWVSHFEQFRRKLLDAVFGAVVFDYDGTLISESQRFSGPDGRIAKCLTRLLQKGIVVAIATGRGESVRRDLKRLLPAPLWPLVLVAYHNGAEICSLTESVKTNVIHGLSDIQALADTMKLDTDILSLAEVKVHPHQISIVPPLSANPILFWQAANEIVQRNADKEFSVCCSSHSIDILRTGVTKLSIIPAIKSLKGWNPAHEILCIGDRGQWPGNDCELLSYPYSLSAYTASNDPKTCWNLAPAGHRGPQAVLGYCDHLIVKRGTFKVKAGIFGGTQK